MISESCFLIYTIFWTLPLVPVEVGHSSCTMCTLGNIAYELDRPLEWNPIVQKFMNDVEANSKLHYEYRKPYSLD